MELIEFGSLTDAYRHALEGNEIDPFDASGIGLQFRSKADRRLDIPEAVPSVITALLSRQPIYAVSPFGGALGRRLAEKTPTGQVKVPVLIAQGQNDHLVLPGLHASL
jgi:hypothetical protein